MFYGFLILFTSLIVALIIRIKAESESCFIKRVLPYIIMFFGGTTATLIVFLLHN